MHNLCFLKDVAFYMDLGEFNDFDHQIETLGQKLFDEDPNNPYVNSYLGTYFSRKGDIEKARFYFENIIDADNFSEHWYKREAQAWLNENQ